LQTALPLALKAGLDISLIVQKMAVNPRQILNIDIPAVAEGQAANIVLIDIDAEWEYTRKNNRSKSYNSPFIGQNLKGKVLLTCNNNQSYK
jgi:dihydroorotase